MTKIRLARRGRHNTPFYHIVVCNSRSQRDGKFIEKIGFYDPLKKTDNRADKVSVNSERLSYWIGVGAQLTDTVQRLIKK